MDISEKAKAYDEALERAKKELQTCGSTDCDAARQIFRLFPELTESEDEKMRRELISYFKNNSVYIKWSGLDVKKVIEWLEKQGEKDNWAEELNTKIKELHKQCLAKIQEYNTPTIIWHSIDEKPEEMKELFCEWESDDATWHDVAFYDEGSHTFRHAKMPINVTKWVYVDELLEKQVELKTPNIDEMKFKVGGAVSVYGNPFDYEHASITQKDFAPKCVNGTFQVSTEDCWCADKPKFHEGDWIVHHGTENIYQVVAVIDNQYQLKYGDNYTIQKCADVDRCARLWDITKDAKDGDVLVIQKTDITYESIFIFNKIENNRIIQYLHYFTTDADEEVCEAGSIDGFLGFAGTTIHPATKEQRDTLERAMTNAGYRWNKEELKLEKI